MAGVDLGIPQARKYHVCVLNTQYIYIYIYTVCIYIYIYLLYIFFVDVL